MAQQNPRKRSSAGSRITRTQRRQQEYLKAMQAAVAYVDAVRACIQAEYRCRKALPRDEAAREKLLHMFATQGLISALQIQPEKTAMLHRARDLRSNFSQPLNDWVSWED